MDFIIYCDGASACEQCEFSDFSIFRSASRTLPGMSRSVKDARVVKSSGFASLHMHLTSLLIAFRRMQFLWDTCTLVSISPGIPVCTRTSYASTRERGVFTSTGSLLKPSRPYVAKFKYSLSSVFMVFSRSVCGRLDK